MGSGSLAALALGSVQPAGASRANSHPLGPAAEGPGGGCGSPDSEPRLRQPASDSVAE